MNSFCFEELKRTNTTTTTGETHDEFIYYWLVCASSFIDDVLFFCIAFATQRKQMSFFDLCVSSLRKGVLLKKKKWNDA